MNPDNQQYSDYEPRKGSSNTRLAAGVALVAIVVVSLFFAAIFLMPSQQPTRNSIKATKGHVDIIDSDPIEVNGDLLVTRCYQADIPTGYAAKTKQGCSVVLNIKESGGLLTAVYVSAVQGNKSLDEIQGDYVKQINDAAKDNPKINIIGKSSTTTNGSDTRVIDYTDPYELKYRYYVIAAPAGKYSYNSQPVSAFTIAGYMSQKLPKGHITPVETVAKNFQYIQ